MEYFDSGNIRLLLFIVFQYKRVRSMQEQQQQQQKQNKKRDRWMMYSKTVVVLYPPHLPIFGYNVRYGRSFPW